MMLGLCLAQGLATDFGPLLSETRFHGLWVDSPRKISPLSSAGGDFYLHFYSNVKSRSVDNASMLFLSPKYVGQPNVFVVMPLPAGNQSVWEGSSNGTFYPSDNHTYYCHMRYRVEVRDSEEGAKKAQVRLRLEGADSTPGCSF